MRCMKASGQALRAQHQVSPQTSAVFGARSRITRAQLHTGGTGIDGEFLRAYVRAHVRAQSPTCVRAPAQDANPAAHPPTWTPVGFAGVFG